jgi:signal transduction histidine kinase
MIWRWLRRHPSVVDVGLVAFLLIVGVGAAVHSQHDRPAALILGAVETLPLLFRRRYPVEVTLTVAAAALAMVVLEVWIVPVQLGVALYTLGAAQGVRRHIALGTAVIVALGIGVFASDGLAFGAAAARVVFLAAAMFLGESIGSRRAYIHEIEDRAERLERQQETERERAAAQEQARIAREFHDVIAHALSVIVVQASAALDAFDRDPARARAPIEHVENAARTALADLRRVLGVLHTEPDYEPQPSLDQVDDLVDRIRTTGLDVSLEIEGARQSLPAALDLSAYRIVQEALTNVLKHAHASRIDVQIRYGDTLQLDVRDDGNVVANGTPNPLGRGLIGMRERAALLGGTFDAGPEAAGGYRVHASFPLTGDA